jgi:hypothetical protein
MTSVGFEPIISAGERPQTHALDSAVILTGKSLYTLQVNIEKFTCKWFAYKRFFSSEIYVLIEYVFCHLCFAYADNIFRDILI